jgi:hypothetical protein
VRVPYATRVIVQIRYQPFDESGCLGLQPKTGGRSHPKLNILAAVIERKSLVVSRMIPGNWGKVELGWLARPLLAGSQGSEAEAGFTGSSGRGRTRSVMRKGTWRRGAIRNRSELDQVVQAGFEPGRIAVTQRVNGCYCASARGA